jgi:membrane-associated protease RseP (regulator of RpoE activity)
MIFTVGVVLFALGIGVSIALHEFGHLLSAKAFGMKATQYFIGFGPTLFSFRRGETEYGLKAIPAGGFVKIIGMTPQEEEGGGQGGLHGWGQQQPTAGRAARAAGTPGRARAASPAETVTRPGAGGDPAGADSSGTGAAGTAGPFGARPVGGAGGSRAFWRFPAWKRITVLSAGSAMHFAIAIVALYGVALTTGLPTEKAIVGEVQPCVVTVGQTDGTVRDCRTGDPRSPAAQAGLRQGDRVVQVDTTPIGTFDDLVRALRAKPGQSVQITYVRDGTRHTATMTIASVRRKPIDAERAGTDGLANVGAIGVAPATFEKRGPLGAVPATFRFTGTVVEGTFSALKSFPSKVPQLFGALEGQKRDPNGPVSVVGVSRAGGQALQAGSVLFFVLLLAGFNIFVGVFNLFPLLPLDGGHIAIVAFEQVRSGIARVLGRADPGRVDYAKLMPLTMLVIAVFGGISLLAILADIVNPIANPFQ